MLFCIISYHRAERQLTLDMLTKNGVKPEDIILSLNDPQDLEAYAQRYGNRATIICREKHNAAGNRNNILDLLPAGTKIVLLDDDVKGLVKWTAGGKQGKVTAVPFREFTTVLEDGFALCEAYGSRLFGFYPAANAMFMKQAKAKARHSFNKLFQGGCMGIITSEERFDERIPVCDDYDYILGQIARGLGAIRINGYAAAKDKDFSTKGGCYEAYQNGAQKKALLMIAGKYPNLVTVKKDFTGLRMKKGSQ